KTGATPAADALESLVGDEVPWLSPGDVGRWLACRAAERKLTSSALKEGWVPEFPRDSTLVVGIGATAGKVAHLEERASGNQQMTCLTPTASIDPRFLSWQLLSRREEVRATAPFTTLPIITNEFLKSLLVWVPEKVRQVEIRVRLDQAASRLSRLTESLAVQIERMREHRQALITAAVTGNLGIPGAGA